MEEHNYRLQIKDKRLVMRPKHESVFRSATKVLLLKTPCLRLVCTLDRMGTVML